MNKQEKIRLFYDSYWSDYDRHMRMTGHYQAQEKVIQKLMHQIREPILDLASGTGFLIKLLKKIFSEVFGNDFSLNMVKAITEDSQLIITNENAEVLGSYQEKFKTIICCNLLFYVQDQRKAIKRWSELLDKDGKIIVIEEYPFIVPRSKEMSKSAQELIALISPLSPPEIKELMAKHGFYLVTETKTGIDNKHNLWGLVFSIK